MPFTCSVPNCDGNHRNGPKVAVFSFPKNLEERYKWIRAIKRNFTPTTSSRVCQLHFAPTDILRETTMFDEKNGRTISAPLKFPRLKDGAIPSLMPKCPAYMSNDVVIREAPEDRRQRKEQTFLLVAMQDSVKQHAEYEKERQFTSLEELNSRLHFVTLPDNWYVINAKSKIMFLNLSDEPAPAIKASVIISKMLYVSANVGSHSLNDMGKDFHFPLKVNNTSLISDIIKYVNRHKYENQK